MVSVVASDRVLTSKPGDQFPEQGVELFLLSGGEYQQEPHLVRPMAIDRFVDHAPAGVGERDQLAAAVVRIEATLARAVAAASTADPNPVQDHGFMYGRSVEDPDGYVWEIMWMDASAHAGAPGTA